MFCCLHNKLGICFLSVTIALSVDCVYYALFHDLQGLFFYTEPCFFSPSLHWQPGLLLVAISPILWWVNKPNSLTLWSHRTHKDELNNFSILLCSYQGKGLYRNSYGCIYNWVTCHNMLGWKCRCSSGYTWTIICYSYCMGPGIYDSKWTKSEGAAREQGLFMFPLYIPPDWLAIWMNAYTLYNHGYTFSEALGEENDATENFFQQRTCFHACFN